MSDTEVLKDAVRRFVTEVMNEGRLEVIDELYASELAGRAHRWIVPFRESFPDVRMDVVELVAEGETVAARLVCSGTHLGVWRGLEPTRRRFRVDEVLFFGFSGGRIARAWSMEDTYRRLRQLGLLERGRRGP